MSIGQDAPTSFFIIVLNIIPHSREYISPDIVADCFKDCKFTFVDKQICGNGFTTAYLQLKPKPFQVNIIIAPNRQVVLEKQKAYKQGKLKTPNRIGFIYGDGDLYQSDEYDLNKYDVLMFVADSFLERIPRLKAEANRIEKILIDEAHSVEIQSIFRNRLKRFFKVVSSEFSSASIVAVTATPLLHQRPDIVIKSDVKEFRTIYKSENQKKAFSRLQDLIKKNEPVIVATQNARLIRKLAVNGVIEANFKIGTKLKQSLVELAVIKQNDQSNITIISSTGFEGFDVLNSQNNIFIFEDRARDEETFFAANIIQIIGRSRKGTKYIEWCRLPHSKGRKKIDTKHLLNKLLSRRISTEKKITDKNYKDLLRFTLPSKNSVIAKGQYLLEFDIVGKRLYDEIVKADQHGITTYSSFFNDRGFKIKALDEGQSRFTIGKVSEKVKAENIKANRDYISQYKVYDGIYLKVVDQVSIDRFYKHVKEYLRRKYWAIDNPEYLENEKKLIYLLSDEDRFHQYASEIFSIYKADKKADKNISRSEYQKRVSTIEKNLISITGRLLLMFGNKKIKLPSKKRVWRDYNLLTEVSMSIIKKVSVDFGIKVHEVDIKSCNPRILYSVNGCGLPDNFYGENKKNKRKVNIALNSFKKYDERARNKTDKKHQKQNCKRSLLNLGFDETVVNGIVEKFFDSDKGALFNYCAYHEENIIDQVSEILKAFRLSDENSFIRRHDSVLIFGDYDIPYQDLKEFTYLGQKGWFNVDKAGNQKLQKTQLLQKLITSKNGLKAA